MRKTSIAFVISRPKTVLLMPCTEWFWCAVVQSFHSRQGKAYLFNDVVNISEGPKEERLMTTGAWYFLCPLVCTGDSLQIAGAAGHF